MAWCAGRAGGVVSKLRRGCRGGDRGDGERLEIGRGGGTMIRLEQEANKARLIIPTEDYEPRREWETIKPSALFS